MTRKEAIAILENEKKCVNRANKNDYCNRDCYNCELVKTDTEILTALDMAIKALSQEPCDDVVSREYLFKVLDDFCGHDRTATITLDTLADLVYDMPTVTQKSAKDYLDMADRKAKKIKDALTVTQKSGKCKDCKWWRDSDGVYRRGVGAESKCPINNVSVNHGFGYCHMFEPQESEDKE